MTPPTVTQQDRDAAAQCYLELEGPPYSSRDLTEAEAHRAGEYDASAAVQAFARHREQARADAFKEASKIAISRSNYGHAEGNSRAFKIAADLEERADAIEQGAYRHD